MAPERGPSGSSAKQAEFSSNQNEAKLTPLRSRVYDALARPGESSREMLERVIREKTRKSLREETGTSDNFWGNWLKRVDAARPSKSHSAAIGWQNSQRRDDASKRVKKMWETGRQELEDKIHSPKANEKRSAYMKAIWAGDNMEGRRKQVGELGKSKKGIGPKYSQLGEDPGKVLIRWRYAENLSINAMAERAKVNSSTMRQWVRDLEIPAEPIKPEVNTQNKKMIQAVDEGLERGIITRLEAARMKLLYPSAGRNMTLRKVEAIFGVSKQAISQSKRIVLARLRENRLI